MKKQTGFNLVEIMMVLVILGILSFIAIPSYQDYLVRTRFTELLLSAEPFKLALLEPLLEGQDPNKLTTSDLNLSLSQNTNNRLVHGVSLNQGILRLQSHTTALGITKQQHAVNLALTPNWTEHGTLEWHCHLEPQSTGLERFAPKICRH